MLENDGNLWRGALRVGVFEGCAFLNQNGKQVLKSVNAEEMITGCVTGHMSNNSTLHVTSHVALGMFLYTERY